MLSLKINDKPDLTICKMNCDTGLHKKLDQYELTKFMNGHHTNLLIGKPRSGKTSLLYSLFKSPKLFKKVFQKIYLFQPSASRNSMVDNIFNVLPEEQKFDDLSFDNLNQVMAEIKEHDKDINTCIIFDDMTAYLKNLDVKQIMKELIFNRRHLHVSIFFLVQTYKSIEKDIRKLFSNIFIFKVSKNELETIFDELVEMDKKYILPISKIVYDQPYKYLFINLESQRLFKEFDEIIIDR